MMQRLEPVALVDPESEVHIANPSDLDFDVLDDGG
jgi:hypothetical protein